MNYRPIFIAVFIFLEIHLSIAQKNSDDPINGHKSEYFPSGQLMREYDVVNGTLQGVFKMYAEDGALQIEQYLVDGVGNGYYRTFYKNGNLRSEHYMKDGMFEGPSKEYYESGKLKIDRNCSGPASNQSGLVLGYNEEGILISEITLTDGMITLSKTYYADGRPKSEQSPGRFITYTYDRDGNVVKSVNGEEQK